MTEFTPIIPGEVLISEETIGACESSEPINIPLGLHVWGPALTTIGVFNELERSTDLSMDRSLGIAALSAVGVWALTATTLEHTGVIKTRTR